MPDGYVYREDQLNPSVSGAPKSGKFVELGEEIRSYTRGEMDGHKVVTIVTEYRNDAGQCTDRKVITWLRSGYKMSHYCQRPLERRFFVTEDGEWVTAMLKDDGHSGS